MRHTVTRILLDELGDEHGRIILDHLLDDHTADRPQHAVFLILEELTAAGELVWQAGQGSGYWRRP